MTVPEATLLAPKKLAPGLALGKSVIPHVLSGAAPPEHASNARTDCGDGTLLLRRYGPVASWLPVSKSARIIKSFDASRNSVATSLGIAICGTKRGPNVSDQDVPSAPDELNDTEPGTKLLEVLSHWKAAFKVCAQRAVPEGGGQALLPLKVRFDMVT
jgi:hypothetical protein